MNEVESRGRDLVGALQARREDRGFMADLRRGFSADLQHKAWPHVAQWCDLTRDRDRAIHVTVMAGFANHPNHAVLGNLGITLRKVAIGQAGMDGLRSFEARFRRILTCTTVEEVCRHVAYVIRAAAARDIPVDYVELYKDLAYWSERNGGQQIKVRWAAGFWSEKQETDAVAV